MSAATGISMFNGQAVDQSAVPCLDIDTFQAALLQAMREDARVGALFSVPDEVGGASAPAARLWAVLIREGLGKLELLSTRVAGSFPSLTPDLPAVHLFEREIHEQCGVVPDGHPWLKPVRRPLMYDSEARGGVGLFRMSGEEIHEVAVGPVHAGVIEPGHFRFQCHGERVFHLEVVLGYQHRGVEKALRGTPGKRSMHLAETLAGDTTVGHATAHALALEGLAGSEPPPRAHALRAIALELERLANHTGDIGALAGDAGYLPTASFCGRIRGDFLQMTAELCGSRFGRGLVRPGGVAIDPKSDVVNRLRSRLEVAFRDVRGAVSCLWDSPSVRARFDDVGVVSTETARALGLVGPSGRASGLKLDVRRDLPTGAYRFAQMKSATWESGDVFARAFLRWMEIEHSFNFLRDLLAALPPGKTQGEHGNLRPSAVAVGCTEGWRGEIVHVAITDGDGRFDHYKVVDPSFHNWMGLAVALRGQQMSDFPLCNKSFNLSYCGHDL